MPVTAPAGVEANGTEPSQTDTALTGPSQTDTAQTGLSLTGTSLTVGEVAEREGLSAQYAGKLIRMLGKAGLVESVRGCKGGYRLARPAVRISLAETLAALGSKLYEPEVCERFRGDRSFCVHTTDCSLRSLWSGLQLMIDQVLAKTTLLDLIGSERTMNQWMASNAALLKDLAESPARAAASPVFTNPVSLNKETR